MTDAASASAPAAPTNKTVMVTGANGFLASYMVKDLLASGHTVHACIRDATREESVKHLQVLPGASERLVLFSTGDLAQVTADTKTFDVPMKNCQAVLHAATPLNVKFGDHNGEQDIYQPAMASTQELLNCLERHSDTVKCLVLTSSMSAIAPRPEPTHKDESHWSDPKDQKERDNWYGCTKTLQEQMARDWVKESKASGKIANDFCYAAICPTMVIGPTLKHPDDPKDGLVGTMGNLQRWLRGGCSQAPNDSMSFIDVQDCAHMHTRILELKASDINDHQRYMCLIESLHWNDILTLMKELHPGLPDYTPYEGSDILTPTQFNLDHMKSLQVSYKTTRQALQDAITYLKRVDALD